MKRFCTVVLACCLLQLSLPALADTAERDPWEGFNRAVFVFNDTADRYLLRPSAKAYHHVTPDFIETGISNGFANLLEPVTIINDLFQLKLLQAVKDSGRFLLNTTVGLLGVVDVASKLGLERNQEDFGQTLAYWGVPQGPYLMLPFLGPRTVTSGIGGFIDGDLLFAIDHVPTRNQAIALRALSERAALLDAEDLLSGDRYTFIRDVYLQRRDYLINDGVVADDFGDQSFDEDW